MNALLARLMRGEAPGYFAMAAFLCAYLLNVADTGELVQTALNLSASVVGATYLLKKNALPSVISNVAWAIITMAGFLAGS